MAPIYLPYIPFVKRMPDLGMGLSVFGSWQSGVSNDILEFDWYHRWSVSASDEIEGRTHVPMVWSPRDTQSARAIRKSASGEFFFLGNEPERADQSNTSVEESMPFWGLWKDHRRWAGPGILVSGQGKRWFREWAHRCREDGIDPPAIHVHIYTKCYSPDHWMAEVDKVRGWLHYEDWGNKPLYISETCNYTAPGREQFTVMEGMRAALDQDIIHGAAWFAPNTKGQESFEPRWGFSDLFDDEGELTEAGKAWNRIVRR